MKTIQYDMHFLTDRLLTNSLSAAYNKVERIMKFNRTNFRIVKQYDFLYSVDWEKTIPQICIRKRNS